MSGTPRDTRLRFALTPRPESASPERAGVLWGASRPRCRSLEPPEGDRDIGEEAGRRGGIKQPERHEGLIPMFR
jgi:hypothetical protein